MAHRQPGDPEGAGSVICDTAGDVTGVASEVGVAVIPGVAAAAGAAAVTASGITGGPLTSGEEALSRGLRPEM